MKSSDSSFSEKKTSPLSKFLKDCKKVLHDTISPLNIDELETISGSLESIARQTAELVDKMKSTAEELKKQSVPNTGLKHSMKNMELLYNKLAVKNKMTEQSAIVVQQRIYPGTDNRLRQYRWN